MNLGRCPRLGWCRALGALGPQRGDSRLWFSTRNVASRRGTWTRSCAAARGDARPDGAASSRGDQGDVRKIRAIAGRVSRDQRPFLNFRMGSDVEIGQRRCSVSSVSAVLHEGLGGQPSSCVRQCQPLKDHRVKPTVQLSDSREGRRQFGVDDGVDLNRPQCCRRAELGFRSTEPLRVRGRNVQQDIGVEQEPAYSSPRVSTIIFAVDSPGRAAPRARWSQFSTGGGVARLTRRVSSQPASSSTCGVGSFSMALSISAMLLMAEI